MILDEEDYLAHYGILRRSGRYPWGSGKTQSSRNKKFLEVIGDLEKQGLTPVQICRAFDIKDEHGNVTESFSTTQLRAAKTIAKNEQKQLNQARAQKLKDKGMSNPEIAKRMGLAGESSVRALLADGAKEKASILTTTAEMLRQQVDKKTYIDVGKGVEHHNGITKSTLDNAVAMLREEGYALHSVPVEQLGTGKKTNVKVLAPPGTQWGDVSRNRAKIQQIASRSKDFGRSQLGILPPISIDSKRVQVVYGPQGGNKADGVMFVRPGVKDVSIGAASYAQVRVTVDGSHYLKGMAVYKHDLPKGVDIQFHTNKDDTGNKLDALKPLKTIKATGKIDKDNPYGANIKDQITEKVNGKDVVTSAMNIVNQEGKWSEWSRTLSSQMLSKQNPTLAKRQLDLTFKQRQDEFKRISELTNPEVKKKLLEDFGDESDSAAVHLKAAAIPGTHGHHVILPIASMKPTEIYAPNYAQGERVVLIRHPHGGTFEIPELTVNNRNREAKGLLKQARDAVGIHHSVAERLSGADFDGDTVLVIPNRDGKVKTTAALEKLKNFDPQREYKGYPGMKVMTKSHTQIQMGEISNLITDMTIKKASTDELARAVRHSMVVIDAHKHELNYKQSAIDHNINELKVKYQGPRGEGGAATLISRAGATIHIPQRDLRKASKGGSIDPKTGERVYEPTGRSYTNPKTGKTVLNTSTVERLAYTKNAHELSSGTRIESIYADHSNRLKDLGNKARLESLKVPKSKYSESAAKTYAPEVKSLVAKLRIAERNAPLERQAQILAGAVYKQKLENNPGMDDAEKKKLKYQALTEQRARMGAKKEAIEITDKEWEAIQAGAITPSRFNDILANANMERVRELASPRSRTLLTPSRVSQAQSLLAAGYTRAEVATKLGVSLSTLDAAIHPPPQEGG